MRDVVAPHWEAQLRLVGCILVGVIVYAAALLVLFSRRIKLILSVITRATGRRPFGKREVALPRSVPEQGS
jgi:hypothetical protein